MRLRFYEGSERIWRYYPKYCHVMMWWWLHRVSCKLWRKIVLSIMCVGTELSSMKGMWWAVRTRISSSLQRKCSQRDDGSAAALPLLVIWTLSVFTTHECTADTTALAELKHLHGLLKFLQVQPWENSKIWNRLIKKPYLNHDEGNSESSGMYWLNWMYTAALQRLSTVLQQIMIRNREADIEREIVLPPCKISSSYFISLQHVSVDVTAVKKLPCTPVEAIRYNQLVVQIKTNLIVSSAWCEHVIECCDCCRHRDGKAETVCWMNRIRRVPWRLCHDSLNVVSSLRDSTKVFIHILIALLTS